MKTRQCMQWAFDSKTDLVMQWLIYETLGFEIEACECQFEGSGRQKGSDFEGPPLPTPVENLQDAVAMGGKLANAFGVMT